MKLLIRFLLPLCILLLSGISRLYAHENQDCIVCSPVQYVTEAESARTGAGQSSQILLSKSSSSNTQKESRALVAEVVEVEEEKMLSKRKHLENSSHFVASCYSLLWGYFYCIPAKHALLSSCSFYLPSTRRYLLFRVFRL